MSYVEQTRDWTEQERLEWIKTYQGMLDTPINSWIPEYAIDYKKKCCDNCNFEIDSIVYPTEFRCILEVYNHYSGIIVEPNTFYCSYHKFKV